MSTSINWVRHPETGLGEVWEVSSGCSPAVPGYGGCLNCWAARLAATRLKHHPDYQGLAYQWIGDDLQNMPGCYEFTGEVRLLPHNLDKPLHWRTPRMVFVSSKSDLYHPAVPADYIQHVYEVMESCPQHIFVLCTKRPERIVPSLYGETSNWFFGGGDYLPNVIHLTSAENQAAADRRIPALLHLRLECDAWQCGVSFEPLLGPVDASPWMWALSWSIAGCESGPGRRAADPDWFRQLRNQCRSAGVPYFCKQMEIGGKVVSMPELDNKVWPEFPGGLK